MPILEPTLGERNARYARCAIYFLTFAVSLVVTALGLALFTCSFDLLNSGTDLIHIVPEGMTLTQTVQQHFGECSSSAAISARVVVPSTIVATVTTIGTYLLTEPGASFYDILPNFLTR